MAQQTVPAAIPTPVAAAAATMPAPASPRDTMVDAESAAAMPGQDPAQTPAPRTGQVRGSVAEVLAHTSPLSSHGGRDLECRNQDAPHARGTSGKLVVSR